MGISPSGPRLSGSAPACAGFCAAAASETKNHSFPKKPIQRGPQWGSNPHPHAYEAHALPTELFEVAPGNRLSAASICNGGALPKRQCQLRAASTPRRDAQEARCFFLGERWHHRCAGSIHSLRVSRDQQQGRKKSGHPESNQGPSDCCNTLQSDALPTEL